MLQRLIPLLLISMPWPLCAQTENVTTVSIKGHFIGESISELLTREPDVQQQVTACEQRRSKPICEGLLAAVKRGERAEFSNSRWTSFVVDGGKLVKIRTLLDGTADAAKADLTIKFGTRSSETAFPMQNAMGTGWEDRLSVWDTPAFYVSLREDNNPASQNHHLVLVVESRSEHDRDVDHLK